MDDSRIPAGFSPPFARVTANDRTAWIIITTVLGLIYSLLFGLARVVVSWTTGPGRLQADNVALAVSTVREPSLSHNVQPHLTYSSQLLAIVQCCITLGACSAGFGKTWLMV